MESQKEITDARKGLYEIIKLMIDFLETRLPDGVFVPFLPYSIFHSANPAHDATKLDLARLLKKKLEVHVQAYKMGKLPKEAYEDYYSLYLSALAKVEAEEKIT